MAGHGSCSYNIWTNLTESVCVSQVLLSAICDCSSVCVCVLSSGALHGRASGYLFHQFNCQLFIHSEGYLIPCTCNFCNCPESDHRNQSRDEKFNFLHYLHFFFFFFELSQIEFRPQIFALASLQFCP